MTLSPQPRPPLDGENFDIVVIGGGINGVAIARECARAGRRTLLVERNDFACGTTSRSTRIIHGGLRYLEHGEIGLVRESLRERQRLLAERPHVVRPMQFVLALPPGRRSALEVRFGLWLYRKFAGGRLFDSRPEVLERLLDRNGDSLALRLFTYDDAQCEFPERLVAEWLCDALHFGAVVRNHTRALAVRCTNGAVTGAVLRDDAQEYEVHAATIINATGPWADKMCRDSGIATSSPMIGGVRGSHIVLPRFSSAPDVAVYTEAPDGRPVFCIPWNGQILFGTTEVDDASDPGKAQPSEAEIEYLVTALKRLFPKAPVHEISFAFAGVRPLPYAPGRNAAAVTRRHFLHDHSQQGAAGMISVIGGKLTTAASLARECVRQLGIDVQEPAHVALLDAAAISAAVDRVAKDVAKVSGLDAHQSRALVSRRGARAVDIARHIALDELLRSPLPDAGDYLLGEATYAVYKECAVTLGDILLRRVPVALTPYWSEQDTCSAAQSVGRFAGWSEAEIGRQIDNFDRERSAFLVRPAVERVSA